MSGFGAIVFSISAVHEPGLRQAEEHVGAAQRVGERAGAVVLAGEPRLVRFMPWSRPS